MSGATVDDIRKTKGRPDAFTAERPFCASFDGL
jgi:hypothetical protein